MKRPLNDEYNEVMEFERRARVERRAKIALMLIWIGVVVAYAVGIVHPEWFK